MDSITNWGASELTTHREHWWIVKNKQKDEQYGSHKKLERGEPMCSRRVSISSYKKYCRWKRKETIYVKRKRFIIIWYMDIWIFHEGKPDGDDRRILLVMALTDFGIVYLCYHYNFMLYKNFWRKSWDPIIHCGGVLVSNNHVYPVLFLYLYFTSRNLFYVLRLAEWMFCFVDIDGIVEHLKLNVLFKTIRAIDQYNP